MLYEVITRGYVVAQLAAMMDPAIPKNEGFFDSIHLVVPEGCCLNPVITSYSIHYTKLYESAMRRKHVTG